MQRVSLLALVSAMSVTPALAQSTSDTGVLGLRGSDVAVSGQARQLPNTQPIAPSAPVGDTTAAGWPGSVVPYKGYGFAGGTLRLGITAATLYDDNVFAGRTNRLSDVSFIARPEFSWIKQGAGYGVGVDGYVEAKQYVKYSSEDQVNGSIGTNFTVMPDADTQVIGNARYIRAHLERGTSETIGPGGFLLSTAFNSPIEYDQGVGSLALNKRFDRWWTSVGIAGSAVQYKDPTIAGIDIDLSYAEGVIAVANGRLGYVVAPQTSVFVEAAGNTRDWKVGVFDSTGYRAVGGVLFEQGPNARLRGEGWAGYMSQTYNGVSFQNVSSWTYGAAMAFLFTDQLTGTIEGRREAKEAALSLGVIGPNTIGANAAVCAIGGGASCVSAIGSSISGRLDYRILPNLVVGGGASLQVDEYLGAVAGNRVDQTLSPLASIKYFPTDLLVFGFDYRRVNFDPSGGQSASVSAISYYRNVYLLSANGKF
ncbi:MAG: putative beta-barrel porin 2 [Tardiphaga sp.]|nr:putative beta-barrel porin 2 [Tardiphaga sp.]